MKTYWLDEQILIVKPLNSESNAALWSFADILTYYRDLLKYKMRRNVRLCDNCNAEYTKRQYYYESAMRYMCCSYCVSKCEARPSLNSRFRVGWTYSSAASSDTFDVRIICNRPLPYFCALLNQTNSPICKAALCKAVISAIHPDLVARVVISWYLHEILSIE